MPINRRSPVSRHKPRSKEFALTHDVFGPHGQLALAAENANPSRLPVAHVRMDRGLGI